MSSRIMSMQFGDLTMRTASVTVASPCGPMLAARRLDRDRMAEGRSSRGEVSDALWALSLDEAASAEVGGKPFVPYDPPSRNGDVSAFGSLSSSINSSSSSSSISSRSSPAYETGLIMYKDMIVEGLTK